MSSPSGFLPAIPAVKSSLPAAVRIYAAMDYLDQASASRLHKKKKRKAARKRPRTASPRKDDAQERSARSREYSKDLKVRKEKARIAKAKDEEDHKHYEEMKVKGLREKARLNQLFAIYATQQDDSYRSCARIQRPKFPNLFKAPPKGKSPVPTESLDGGQQ